MTLTAKLGNIPSQPPIDKRVWIKLHQLQDLQGYGVCEEQERDHRVASDRSEDRRTTV